MFRTAAADGSLVLGFHMRRCISRNTLLVSSIISRSAASAPILFGSGSDTHTLRCRNLETKQIETILDFGPVSK